jgi:hypothetical protein
VRKFIAYLFDWYKKASRKVYDVLANDLVVVVVVVDDGDCFIVFLLKDSA